MNNNLRLLEAVLFASQEPISEKKLAEYFEDGFELKTALKELQKEYEHKGVHVVQLNNCWAFRTAEDLAERLGDYKENVKKLSRAAMETLSIIAYHQPVSRAEIEEIRGVALSKGTLDVLFEAGWIKPRGRRRTPGRPMTWGTTIAFLDQFGLEKIDDLPGVDELKAAGLLDSRPALNTYGVRGEMELPLDDPNQEENLEDMISPEN